eukprot:scaffold140_cov565-Prasinococcus_capsulatus_cf.AAC.11
MAAEPAARADANVTDKTVEVYLSGWHVAHDVPTDSVCCLSVHDTILANQPSALCGSAVLGPPKPGVDARAQLYTSV